MNILGGWRHLRPSTAASLKLAAVEGRTGTNIPTPGNALKHGFYVYMETISDEGGKRTVQQAIDYITDDHDSKRLGNINDQMIAYICRIDPGYKTEHEGGKVPLIGHGVLTDVTGITALTWEFNEATVPADRRGKKGYKSVTLTLPKELTLVCETDKAKARAAITRAIDATLPHAYPHKRLHAVSAMHTRNEAGDPHINVHLLIAKTVKDERTGKRHSINNLDMYEDNTLDDAERMKIAWKREIVKELEIEFNIQIEFTKNHKCKVTAYDGLELEPLTRATERERQRAWEMANAPQIELSNGMKAPFKINIIDAKILEVARIAPLTKENFLAVFPKYEEKWIIDKRIETLQKVYYLDKNLKPTTRFLEHAKSQFGNNPEWKQIKEDVDNILGKLVDKVKEENPSALPTIIEQIFTNPLKLAVENSPALAERVKRLEPTPITLDKIQARWVDMRKQITPELKTWASKVHEHARFVLKTKKNSETMPYNTKMDYIANMRPMAIRLKKESKKEYSKAVRSLEHPLLKGHNTLVTTLTEDRKLYKSIQRKIEQLETQRDNTLFLAGEHQKPFIIKYFKVQLDELTRTAIKLRGEINQKQAKALRIEVTIPENSKTFTKTTTKPGSLAVPPDLAQRMYQQIFHGRTTLEDYLGEKSPLIGQHLTSLRRGYKVLEILGYKEAETLRTIMTGGLDKLLLKQHIQHKTPKDLAMATIKAQEIGSILTKAEFFYIYQKSKIPATMLGTKAEPKVALLFARLNALGAECPDLSKLTSPKFMQICDSDERLRRLTSEGASYMMDWQYKNNELYDVALGRFASDKTIDKAPPGREIPNPNRDNPDTHRKTTN
jgi:hypothetical protein